MEFSIPARSEALLNEGEGLRVDNAADYSGSSPEELVEVAEGMIQGLLLSLALLS